MVNPKDTLDIAVKAIDPIMQYRNRKQEAEDLLNGIKRKAKAELTAWSHNVTYRGILNEAKAVLSRNEALRLSGEISEDIDKLRSTARTLLNLWLLKNLKPLKRT